jgi:hypothetical protein
MDCKPSINAFLFACLFGAGFTLGAGLVGLVFDLLAKAAN